MEARGDGYVLCNRLSAGRPVMILADSVWNVDMDGEGRWLDYGFQDLGVKITVDEHDVVRWIVPLRRVEFKPDE